MNPKVIVINGKTYNSVEEMPPDIRQKYEQAIGSLGDANGNHIPDVFENVNILADQNKNSVPNILENLVAGQAVVNSMKIIIDGKEFNGIENLPPEARAKYEKAMAKLDANGNGIPDFVEGMMKTTNQTVNTSSSFETVTPLSLTPSPALAPNVDYPQDKPLPVSPTATQTPDTSNGWMLALSGLLFILLLCIGGAAAAWYFFLR